MKAESVVDKISIITRELDEVLDKQKVIVASPSLMMLIKDRITRLTNIQETRFSFVYDGITPIFMSEKLRGVHFSVVTMVEYEQNKF